MKELVQLRTPDVEVMPDETYHFAGVYSFGRGVFRGPIKKGNEFAYQRLSRVRAKDFVYPKLMAWEGAYGVVPGELDGLVVSTEFPVFEVDESKVLPEILEIHFQSPAVWENLSGKSTGTNVRRRRLNPKEFLAYEFPLPSLEDQKRIHRVKMRIDEITHIDNPMQDELNSLLSTVIATAFQEGA